MSGPVRPCYGCAGSGRRGVFECGRCGGTGRAPESATAHVERHGDLRASGSVGPGRAKRKPVIRTRHRRWTSTPEGRG